MLRIEAHRLLLDQEDGCITSDYRNGAPRIVMPRPGGPIPRTRGMVSDATAREVTLFRMADSIVRQRAMETRAVTAVRLSKEGGVSAAAPRPSQPSSRR